LRNLKRGEKERGEGIGNKREEGGGDPHRTRGERWSDDKWGLPDKSGHGDTVPNHSNSIISHSTRNVSKKVQRKSERDREGNKGAERQ
jgi:hypothetical protein